MAGGEFPVCQLSLDSLQIDATHYPDDPLGPIVCVGCGIGCHQNCYMDAYNYSCPDATWLCRSCISLNLPLNFLSTNDETAYLDPMKYILFNQQSKSLKLDITSPDQVDHPLLNNIDIDPDSNIYAGLSWDSLYESPESLTDDLKTKLSHYASQL